MQIGVGDHMRFDLSTPCKDCPFRSDITFYLHPERVEEIIEGITTFDQTFSCHKTTVFEADDDGEEVLVRGNRKEQHCAGAMILLMRDENPNQLMRIGMRVGFFDPDKLDMDAPVFDSAEEMQDHYDALGGRVNGT